MEDTSGVAKALELKKSPSAKSLELEIVKLVTPEPTQPKN